MKNYDRRKWLRYLLLAPLMPYPAMSLAANEIPNPIQSTDNEGCQPILSHTIRPLMGPDEHPLCDEHAGKVLLMVNTASRCGFTPQFEALEVLHQRYQSQGFEVLGFPSDDFRQELDSEAEVAQFCELNYGVSFPMFQKIHVTSGDAHPIYRDLASASGTYPRWNFNKYLVDRNGRVIAHFEASELPLGQTMISAVEALL
ncbi:glutathione peroxidase [Granulosicoccus antarcticus]|uniref:Glutathione peroxidase n=1 Tax=Granulosicoccus antarcticus IMCC3135 TaxID=1192854 RepID=A0A2Z2P444_9GAMM|nr:glutathione peroxidase [Granulosicoccus antarcticus]ASJ75437.1 Hydroperoxy fatty acid reductase gpx1 [Granulosicoccus antarcticus IMCC3135]